jgi:hypothetical protein
VLVGMVVPGAPLKRDVGDRKSSSAKACAGEYCSSGTLGTARATQQLFSGVGENVHYRAEVRGALAHRDVRIPEAWAPT